MLVPAFNITFQGSVKHSHRQLKGYNICLKTNRVAHLRMSFPCDCKLARLSYLIITNPSLETCHWYTVILHFWPLNWWSKFSIYIFMTVPKLLCGWDGHVIVSLIQQYDSSTVWFSSIDTIQFKRYAKEGIQYILPSLEYWIISLSSSGVISWRVFFVSKEWIAELDNVC